MRQVTMRFDVLFGFIALASAAVALIWYMPVFLQAMNSKRDLTNDREP